MRSTLSYTALEYLEYFNLLSGHIKEVIVKSHDHEEDKEQRHSAQHMPHIMVVIR